MANLKEQKLVDILVECTMMVHDSRNFFKNKSYDEVGDWIREQLEKNGIPSIAVGMTHVRLT